MKRGSPYEDRVYAMLKGWGLAQKYEHPGTNGYCNSYDCIVGCKADACDTKIYVETAYRFFFPAQYVSENLDANDDRFRILYLAKDAYEIDRALELAMSA